MHRLIVAWRDASILERIGIVAVVAVVLGVGGMDAFGVSPVAEFLTSRDHGHPWFSDIHSLTDVVIYAIALALVGGWSWIKHRVNNGAVSMGRRLRDRRNGE